MSATVLLSVVLSGFAGMTAVGAVLTHGRDQGLLTLADVLVPAVIPTLLVIAVTIAYRGGPTRGWHGAKKGWRCPSQLTLDFR
ncbi:hypothetical protein [Candidatus Mycobacterium methanotrophicum]|uniref:hypothetical protein n=1 Tax=Candidatus Mycobacterium methanotrophicum TaxID=2943498 RepID=UPI001C55A991|nr:hypothetical protein [Candidatus Mycobacterium methanotrophicum]